MYVKITVPQQVMQLRKGDVLFKCRSGENPNDKHGQPYQDNVEIYEIRSINVVTDMIELVAPVSSYPMFTLPGDVARQFIKSGCLISNGIWWLR